VVGLPVLQRPSVLEIHARMDIARHLDATGLEPIMVDVELAVVLTVGMRDVKQLGRTLVTVQVIVIWVDIVEILHVTQAKIPQTAA
jgi:hypothetical protein